jgi:rRNA maturation protein Rpf1
LNKKFSIKQNKRVKKKFKEEIIMTVINDVKTALAGLKSAQASFETFALGTDNQQAKQLYQDAAKQTQSVVDSIEPRVQQIEQEEPQYKQQ